MGAFDSEKKTKPKSGYAYDWMFTIKVVPFFHRDAAQTTSKFAGFLVVRDVRVKLLHKISILGLLV